ncbi:MAG: T9SS type A sorting domain-containing protein [Flavobacteriales bacterium]
MKTISTLLLLAIITTASNYTLACVDYHPDSIRVVLSGDTSGCNLEVRVQNLQMFGGNPNQFCSCGVIGSYDLGPDKPFFIDYVVFVDAVTNIPVEGFDAFNFLNTASTSWENVDPTAFDWSGFVSLVNSSGIVAGQDVDLVIRGHYEHADCKDDLFYILIQKQPILTGGGFGTDEWSNANNDLALSHNDITYFDDILEWDDVDYVFVDSYYFDFLDGLVLSSPEIISQEIVIYPNPVQETISLNLPFKSSIEILDASGRIIYTTVLPANENLQVNQLTQGLYFIRIHSGDSILTSRFIVG